MRLIELFRKIPKDTFVGIWNIDDKRSKCQTPQTYQKVKNIPFGKIANVIDYEVLVINVQKKNNGLLIRVYDKERLKNDIDISKLADEIANSIKLESGGRYG